jgi:MFS family permease
MASEIPAVPDEGRRYRVTALVMLLLVYTFNFVDRQILGIPAPTIKADMVLTDTQLGLLGGPAFALLYSTLAIPLAWLADRTSRTWVITLSLAVWSAFTALCGVAGSFAQLFAFRVGVGVGEALAVYSLGIPLGSAAGVMLGGYIATSIDWRTAFVVVGVAGLVLAPIFRLCVREPIRSTGAQDREPVRRVFGILARKPSFWLLALGASASSMLGYGLAFWLPSLMQRSFGLNLIETAQFYGGILLLGGVAGVLLGGMLGDRLGARDRRMYARIPAIAFAIAVPLFAAGILSSSVMAAFVFFLVPQALAYVWLAPVITAVQHLVPSHMRATASATFLLVNNLVGLGGGSFALGALSDGLAAHYGDEALRYAMLVGLVLYLVAALLMWMASTPLRQDWVDQST